MTANLLALRHAFQDRLQVERFLVRALGDMTAALMLSQLLDITVQGIPVRLPERLEGDLDAWWPVSWGEWTMRLCVSDKTARRAGRKLVELGVVKSQVVVRHQRRMLVWKVCQEELTLFFKKCGFA